jgi:hypothetical protein
LRAALAAAGFAPVEEWWDYGAGATDSAPQFYTIAVRGAGD